MHFFVVALAVVPYSEKKTNLRTPNRNVKPFYCLFYLFNFFPMNDFPFVVLFSFGFGMEGLSLDEP
jgi:hypothetical protein